MTGGPGPDRGPAPKPRKRKGSSAKKPRKRRTGRPIRVSDPSDTGASEIRYVQPYEATKSYLCPGCNREIPPGTGHMVAVPPDDPDLRRHWHRGCWNNRASRR